METLRGKDLDHVDAALPALETALVDSRLDIVAAQARLQLRAVASSGPVILGHQLDAHIPKLPPRNLDCSRAIQINVQKAVCDFGGQGR